MKLCVLDSSVVFKWYRQPGDEHYVSEAVTILENHLNGEIEIHVPDLLVYELGNILIFKENISSESAIQILENTFLLEIIIHPPSSVLMESAYQLAKKYAVTFYDASFLALSQLLDSPFVTADKKLFTKIKSIPKTSFLGLL